jgi:hypothetical protein
MSAFQNFSFSAFQVSTFEYAGPRLSTPGLGIFNFAFLILNFAVNCPRLSTLDIPVLDIWEFRFVNLPAEGGQSIVGT